PTLLLQQEAGDGALARAFGGFAFGRGFPPSRQALPRSRDSGQILAAAELAASDRRLAHVEPESVGDQLGSNSRQLQAVRQSRRGARSRRVGGRRSYHGHRRARAVQDRRRRVQSAASGQDRRLLSRPRTNVVVREPLTAEAQRNATARRSVL